MWDYWERQAMVKCKQYCNDKRAVAVNKAPPLPQTMQCSQNWQEQMWKCFPLLIYSTPHYAHANFLLLVEKWKSDFSSFRNYAPPSHGKWCRIMDKLFSCSLWWKFWGCVSLQFAYNCLLSCLVTPSSVFSFLHQGQYVQSWYNPAIKLFVQSASWSDCCLI